MKLETERLFLRKWKETDSEVLFKYAKDPAVGPIAGWPVHKSVEDSLNVIKNVFTGAECYAVCLKESDEVIGAIELVLEESKDVPCTLTEQNSECEQSVEREQGDSLKKNTENSNEKNDWEIKPYLGYWIGKPFWGKGYCSEAAKEILRHGFEDLLLPIIWCAYYDGNLKSKRVQEKCGFVFHHTCKSAKVPLMNEIRICHVNVLTKDMWKVLT